MHSRFLVDTGSPSILQGRLKTYTRALMTRSKTKRKPELVSSFHWRIEMEGNATNKESGEEGAE